MLFLQPFIVLHYRLFLFISALQKIINNILVTPLGSHVAETRDIMPPKVRNQNKGGVTNTNFLFHYGSCDALSQQEEHH